MKKFLVIISFFILFSCDDNGIDPNTILPNVPVNETLFLNNPQFINLQVVGGWAYSKGGIKGILVYRTGSSSYVAFERACPHITPQACSQMSVKNSIKLVCPCDQSEFSILDGSPQTEGVKYPARQYRVTLMGNNTINISNF